MDRRRSILGVIAAIPLFAACTPQVGPDARIWPVETGTTALDLQATRRGVFFRQRPDGTVIVCAEPSPDVAVTSDTAFSTGLTVPQIANITEGEATLNLDADTTQQLVDLANRGQLLQVQREALYRLCELQANSGLSDVSIYELYDEVLFTIRMFAMSDVLTELIKTEEGRAIAERFVSAAITRSSRPTDLILSRQLSPEAANVLYGVSSSECARLMAASDADLRQEMAISVDETFRRLAEVLEDPAELRRAVEVACAGSGSS